MKKKKLLIFYIIVTIVLLGLMIGITIALLPFIRNLGTEEGRNAFIDTIQGTGFLGAISLIGLQILQVVVAFLPGEVIEFLSGVMFGPWLGLLLCLLGLGLATIMIYFLSKLIGKPFVDNFINLEKENSKFKFLRDPKRALIILFFIFLIPGIPKDIFLYLIPFTAVKFWPFLGLSLIARIPSVITSTIAGNALIEGNYLTTIIVSVVTGILAILGLIFNKQIYNFFNKHSKNKSSNLQNELNEQKNIEE